LLALVVAGAASYLSAHYTVRGMDFQFYALPSAVAAFVITILLLARRGSRVAAWTAVAVGALCFAGSALVRNEGFSGDFRAAFDWRWKPSSEEQ
jgi:hypothetical protein